MTAGSLNIRFRKAGASDCTYFEQCIGLGRRRTLEFDTAVVNEGRAALCLGDPRDNPDQYEWSPCHRHFHLKGSLDYALARGGVDTVSVYDPSSGTLFVRNEFGGPVETAAVAPPAAAALPLAGDWDRDGDSTLGFYDPATSRVYQTNARGGSAFETVFRFRPARTPLLPIAGDWDGDGFDTVGLFDPATRTFFLTNANAKGPAAATFVVSAAEGDYAPIAGDWDGDDVDTVGLYDRGTGVFLLWNESAAGPADVEVALGGQGLRPLAGDWDEDGDDSIGVADPSTGAVRLWNENGPGAQDLELTVEPGAIAIAGDWDYDQGVSLPSLGHKQSFCWLDTMRFSGDGLQHFRDCDRNQGLSQGFGDIYVRGTECQWIDIEDVAPGVYQLVVSVNDGRFIREASYDNNVLLVKVRIPPRRQQATAAKVTVTAPAAPVEVAVGQPVTIRWKLENGARVTRQELWLYPTEGHHRNEARLLVANIRSGARAHRFVPTEELAYTEGIFVVRAQNERDSVGDDGFAPAPIHVAPAKATGRMRGGR